MAVAKAIFTHFFTFLLALIMSLMPFKSTHGRNIDTLSDDCKLTVEILSDTHLEKNGFLRRFMFETALKHINKAKCTVDSILVDGDITNYADEYSIAKYYATIKEKTAIPVISVSGNHDIGHAGDRGVTDITRTQALENFIKYRNEYLGTSYTSNYYSTQINGYKFIVLGDEALYGGAFDEIRMSEEQLRFLDAELAEGTKDGKPVFVCCHWPIKGYNGEDTIWPGSGIDTAVCYDLPSIMSKYKNVYYISGHMHSGIKTNEFSKISGLNAAEKIDGVVYVNLPSFGLVNMFGYPFPGTGMQLEVYDNEVVFRSVNYLKNLWYEKSEYRFEVEK